MKNHQKYRENKMIARKKLVLLFLSILSSLIFWTCLHSPTPEEKTDVALSSAKKITEEMFIEAAEDNMLFLNEYAQAIGSTVRQ